VPSGVTDRYLEDAVVERGADTLVGRVLDGRYRIGARIARGGMATVYEATDLRLDRGCAVKIMHTDLGDDHDFGARFVREAHAAARLSHPNVVSVSDQGDDDGVLFLVMEHVSGCTLRDVIRAEAPMTPARALALLEPVLMALAEAHRCGLVHRDVKPENVLIADDGRVKVADFGLARAFDANTQHTATGGVLIGTVSYLAPELIVNGRADPRSDVYAAGVLLYEMLTGHKPHEGEGAIQIAFKHVNEDVPPPSQGNEQPIPAYVDALVLRATARERERRQADAKVFLQQVRRVRAAVEAGEDDDPELTTDLMPTVIVSAASIDYTDEAEPDVDPEVEDDRRPDHEPTTVLAASRQATVAATGPISPAGVTRTSAAPVTPVAQRPPGLSQPVRRVPPQPTRQPPGPPRVPSGARPAGPRKPRRSRRGPLLLVVAVLLTALAAYAGWWVGIGRYTSTPGVLNLSVKAATARLEDAGLELDVAEQRFSETVTAGSVISSDPAGGSRVLEGSTVDVVVSKGPERYSVPRLRGRPLTDVASLLAAEKLTLGTVEQVWDEKLEEGLVVAASPRFGTELRRGSAVDVTVSKGPKPIRIPDFTGKDGERAQQRLAELGFQVEVTEEHSDEVPEGRVVSQDPSDGRGFRDDEVRLVVSQGPVMVEVPDVRTRGTSDATQTLAALGFEVEVVHTQFYIALDTVVRQSPGAGTSLPKGSTVTIYTV
jgi:beta-lactam-binding protein with PASTA domain/serine/threonine protein kinase